MNKKIGFIGQGWIGKNYADDFERRGYEVTRYALEEPYAGNKGKIRECDIVFIAVPTPSTPEGFDDSIVREALSLVAPGAVAVIKSTLLPGTTDKLQMDFPDLFVTHSPEFLTEATAAHDAANPKRNIIGYCIESEEHKKMAKEVLSVLPKANYELICRAKEAELVKYGGNNWFYFKVVFVNLLYDLTKALGVDYDVIREAMSEDPRVGKSHLIPVHKSGTIGSDNFDLFVKEEENGGRGAGGHCFIKDFSAFKEIYEKHIGDEKGMSLLKAMEDKNIELLVKSGKDLDLLAGVYGEDIFNKN